MWAARTSRSKALAERLGAEEGGDDSAGFTIFDFDGDGDIEDQLLDVIHEVELHHGSPGGHPPLVQLDVYGTGLTESLTSTLERFGLASVQVTPFGFSALAEAS